MLNKLAVIDESECIACTKCIQICPYDAIVGANKQLHTVLKTECTGCGLCVDPCPVDCITMIEIEKPLFDTERAKFRRRQRRKRLQQNGILDQKMEISKEAFALSPSSAEEMKAEITAALLRVKVRKAK